MPSSHAPRPVMLVILDGWGLRPELADNAVRLAHTPAFDRLWANGPTARLVTCGGDVGLPDGQMGNSEVGHLNIGAGRVVMQDLPRINAAIADGSFAQAPALRAMIAALKESSGSAHVVGLMSPGGVHAHQDHLLALARVLVDAGIAVKVHLVSDGRDTPPQSAQAYLAHILAHLLQEATIASVCGRYFAMDRDNRWERVALAYGAMAEGEGAHFQAPQDVLAAAYAAGVSDEFIVPAVIGGYGGMRAGDGVICTSYRADRARELFSALVDPEFSGFARAHPPALAAAAGMASYGAELDRHLSALFQPQDLSNVMGEVVARAGRTQLRMAESEKYPHVTYFLNGGRETPYTGEDRILVPSPKVATYDLQPEMSAPELTARAVEAIGSGRYDLIVLNFANPDMVGHSGNLAATIKAVEAADAGLGRIAEAIEQAGGALVVTADHGNSELMRDPDTDGPHTAHTTNPVPVLAMGVGARHLRDGRLADLAPTLLDLMGLAQPAEMSGRSLLAAAPPA